MSHKLAEPKKPKHFYDVFGWVTYIFKFFSYSVKRAFYAAEDVFIRVLDVVEGSSWIVLAVVFYTLFTDNPIRSLALEGGQAAMSAAPLLLL